MTHLHRPHQPSDFENAVFVLADEPEEENGITITPSDLQLCAPEPLRLVVLMHWRIREQDGRSRSAEAIWSTLTEIGMCSDDSESAVGLDGVRQAVEFLLGEGLVTATSDGDL
ncbi:hypothetical protein ACWD5R_39670 [Streptomyces sp. NPDC002514]